LPPPESFELLAGERISRYHKHAVPFFVGDVDHAMKGKIAIATPSGQLALGFPESSIKKL
jgi:hypothetical protein